MLCKVLVGNKIDLQHNRAVSTEEGQALADKIGALFIEVSAAKNKNIEEMYTLVTKTIIEKQKKVVPVKTADRVDVAKNEATPSAEQSGCC